MLCQTDKSGKVVAMTPEVFKCLGDVHCKGDQTVGWEEVQSAQRLLKGHLRIINHIFNTGADTGSKERTWAAKELRSTVLPVNSLLVKDHKPLTPEGLPKTRPVCGASCSMNGELSEWISEILDAVGQTEETSEAISGEEMRAEIDLLNLTEQPVEVNGMFVGSLDAEALYPSLNIVESSKMCEERVMASGMIFEGVDYGWATRYVALNMSQEDINREKLYKIIPRRKSRAGQRPTVRTYTEEESKVRWRYVRTPEQLTQLEKKRIMSKVVGIMVRATMDNHYYKWDQDIKRQVTGGGIGLRGTGSVSRVVMDRWLLMFGSTLRSNGVRIRMLKKYVDDVLLVCNNLRLGSRWHQGNICFSELWEQEDIQTGKTREQVTLNVMTKIASTQVSFLKFTGEVSEGPERRVPVLDSELWWGVPEGQHQWFKGQENQGEVIPGQIRDSEPRRKGGTVMYSFYSKPMSNPLTILRRSAMPESTKVATISSEVLRRWKCTSEELSSKSLEDITVKYMDNLTGMGYSLEWRKRLLSSTLKGYMRILSQCAEGHSTRNRLGVATYQKRRFRKSVGKQHWFRPVLEEGLESAELPRGPDDQGCKGRQKKSSGGSSKYIEAVLFIPHTPEGTLRASLNSLEAGLRFKTRIKYVEQQGRTVAEMLVRKDPTPFNCGRDTCFTCLTSPGVCTRQGGLYRITCLICKAEGKETCYYGESARTLFDRGQEHLKALKSKNLESPLWEHQTLEHGSQIPEFKMEALSFISSALVRQTTEARKILENGHQNLMNRKGEWGQNLPPKLAMEDQDGNSESGGKRRGMQGGRGPKRPRREGGDQEGPGSDMQSVQQECQGGQQVHIQTDRQPVQVQKTHSDRQSDRQYQSKQSITPDSQPEITDTHTHTHTDTHVPFSQSASSDDQTFHANGYVPTIPKCDQNFHTMSYVPTNLKCKVIRQVEDKPINVIYSCKDIRSYVRKDSYFSNVSASKTSGSKVQVEKLIIGSRMKSKTESQGLYKEENVIGSFNSLCNNIIGTQNKLTEEEVLPGLATNTSSNSKSF